MPGVDDGAADLDEARAGLAVMEEQGVTTIVTTPHIRGSLTHRPGQLERYLSEIDFAFSALETLAARDFPALRLDRGVEMMLDVPVPSFDDPRVRLGATSYVLCEWPHMSIPPNSTAAIRDITAAGVIPIVAHPERYSNMSNRLDLVEDWRYAGAYVQVNSGSLVGQYGSTAERLGWMILEHGWGDFLSSDYHSRGKCAIRGAASAMLERGAHAQLRALTVTNPERMLRGEAPLPVDPLPEVQLGFWQKLFKR